MKYFAQYTGLLAHWIQRATGVALLVYLFLHVHTIHELGEGPVAFNAALETFRAPIFKLAEIGLLATVILHAMNGIRVTLLDLGKFQGRQRALFWTLAIGAGLVLFLAGAIPMFLNGVLKA